MENIKIGTETIENIKIDTEKKLTTEQLFEMLKSCYGQAVNGLPKTKSCYELADEYLKKYKTPEEAAKNFIKWQIAKCTTSGFVTSLGGLITLPVAVPANLVSIWYVQLRMLAVLAAIGGHDPSDDTTQTLAFMCLVGGSVKKSFQEAGVQFANKFALNMVKKIPGEVIKKINQKVGFRFVTKFGTKGIVNIGKMVPVAGGFIGGGIDFVETKIIAKRAYNIFILDKID